MTYVPILYSDKRLPASLKIKDSGGNELIFPDETICEYMDFDSHRDKSAVEDEIRVIRPILPEYNYYLPIPMFADIFGKLHTNYKEEMERMHCINQFLKEVINKIGAKLVFLNVCLGDDYECIDDMNFIQFDLNQSTEDMVNNYILLQDPGNIVEFVMKGEPQP